jgi:mannose-6-phosphate isomerase-like protein (cupin superfamily)
VSWVGHSADAVVECSSRFNEPAPSRHPLGQTLIVTFGKGWTQCEGGPIVEINAGDIIWCPPGHRHWHGATPTTTMTHIAIHEALDGKVVTWMEHVTDDEYRASRPTPHE